MSKNFSIRGNMNKKNNIALITQTFGLNTFDKIAYCQLKSTYNSHFTIENKADCIGVPNMKCLIISIKGTGLIQYWHKAKVLIPTGSIFFGTMKDMRTIKSASDKWHFLCYWYFSHNFENELNGVFPVKNIDLDNEIEQINELIALMQTNTYPKMSLASSIFTKKLINLLDSFAKHSTTNKDMPIDKIITYINAHIKDKISTSDIAKEFGYCEKHIRYLFNKHLDTSPSKYIDWAKLTHIIELLQNTTLSLAEIAELYNYSSASHLIINFKKKFGYTPKQYIYRMKIRIEKSKINNSEL